MEDAKVINRPRACVRVDCLPYGIQSGSQSGYKYITSSQSTCAREREAHAAIRNPKAYFRAWRIAKFGGDFDPIRVAVDEAVAAFSSEKGEAGRESDRSQWLKIANRVGLGRFLDAFEQKASEIRELKNDGKRLWRPAASFQKLLNKRFPKGSPSEARSAKGGAA